VAIPPSKAVRNVPLERHTVRAPYRAGDCRGRDPVCAVRTDREVRAHVAGARADDYARAVPLDPRRLHTVPQLDADTHGAFDEHGVQATTLRHEHERLLGSTVEAR